MRGNKIKRIKKHLKMEKCAYCLSKENLTIDHKIPRAQGGSDDIKNLQCLCMTCNGIKSSMSHKEIRYLIRWLVSQTSIMVWRTIRVYITTIVKNLLSGL